MEETEQVKELSDQELIAADWSDAKLFAFLAGKHVVSIQTAARVLHVTDRHIRRLIQQPGKLKAIGTRRMVTVESLATYAGYDLEKICGHERTSADTTSCKSPALVALSS